MVTLATFLTTRVYVPHSMKMATSPGCTSSTRILRYSLPLIFFNPIEEEGWLSIFVTFEVATVSFIVFWLHAPHTELLRWALGKLPLVRGILVEVLGIGVSFPECEKAEEIA